MSDAEMTNVSSAVELTQSASEYFSSQAPSSPSNVAQPSRPTFVMPDYQPVMSSLCGLEFDFNYGLRLHVSKHGDPRRVLVRDRRSGNLLMDAVLEPNYGLVAPKKYFMDYRIEVRDPDTHELLDFYDMNLKDRDVLIQLPYSGALGDTIAWFSYVTGFIDEHKCRAHVLMPPHIAEIFKPFYKDSIIFETWDSAKKLRPLATYYLGLFFKGDEDWQPVDFRTIGLARQAASILGVEHLLENAPCVDLSAERKIKERYVVVATQASAHAKCWNNPAGWRLVIKNLRERGYRVICIDRSAESGSGDIWHCMPNGCEDFTGDRPLQERIDIIKDADFFIGLNSGLSWLAWCCEVPVVVISGICADFGEFDTPYRVCARHVCHGCWNDTRYEFDHGDYMWCPKHKGTTRAYECTKCISAKQVIDTIDRIPGILKHDGRQEDMA